MCFHGHWQLLLEPRIAEPNKTFLSLLPVLFTVAFTISLSFSASHTCQTQCLFQLIYNSCACLLSVVCFGDLVLSSLEIFTALKRKHLSSEWKRNEFYDKPTVCGEFDSLIWSNSKWSENIWRLIIREITNWSECNNWIIHRQIGGQSIREGTQKKKKKERWGEERRPCYGGCLGPNRAWWHQGQGSWPTNRL